MRTFLFARFRSGSLRPWVRRVSTKVSPETGRELMAAKKSRRRRGDGALFYRADRDRWIGRINRQRQTPHRLCTAPSPKPVQNSTNSAAPPTTDCPVIARDRTVAELLELWRDQSTPQPQPLPRPHRQPRLGNPDPHPRTRHHQAAQGSPSTSRSGVPRRTIPADEQQHPAKDADGRRAPLCPGTR